MWTSERAFGTGRMSRAAAFDLRDHAGRLPSDDRALVSEVLEGSHLIGN